METMQQESLPKNPLYHLAKQITLAQTDAEKEALFEKLGEMLNKIFKTEKIDEIENALTIAAENEENDVMSIIMDDTEIEISHIDFEKEDGEYTSSMLLLPCMMITKEKDVSLPAIGTFQEVIQRHLLEAKLINHTDDFRLGAVRIDNDTIDDLSMNDWWSIHRNIMTDAGTAENEQKLAHRQTQEVGSGLSLFYLVPVVVSKEADETLLENILTESQIGDLWSNVSKELSSSTVGLNVMAPDFITNGISSSQFILQSSELQLLMKEYNEYDNIEMAYMKTDEEGTYLIFFIDNEGNSLADFYLFETDGNETEMIEMLISEVQNFPTQRLWHFDEAIHLDDLETWYEEETTDLDHLMKSAHAVDIREYNQFVNLTATKYLH
jgi:hypothetical protein